MVLPMKASRTIIATLVPALLLLGPQAGAFAPSESLPKLHNARSAFVTSTTRQHVVPPAEQIVETTNQLLLQLDHSHHHEVVVTQMSQLLADAASSAASDQAPTGWWGAYINLFKTLLNGVHSVIDPPLRSVGVTQTWGISIALFTSCTRALLLPLSIQQSKSAEYMKLLKPYVKEIKAKYKGKEEAQNRAIGKLYEDANQNPLSGCLLSLAQIPIFLGLYRGIRLLAMDGALEEPFLFIPSLEGPVSPPDYRGLDWLLQGWTTVDNMPTPPLGWETTLAFLTMPVVLVLLQSFTMSVLQPPADEEGSAEEKKQQETTQTVLRLLPLMIGFFSLQVPAGLTIYWLSSNLFTLTQSLGVRAYFASNPPEIKLPDYWEQMSEKKDFKDMTPEERRKATEAGLSVGPTFEDLVNESKFHVFVERQPFRDTTEAWKRVETSSNDPIPIPLVMQEWVGSSIASIKSKDDANGAHSSSSSEIAHKLEVATAEKTETTTVNAQSPLP
ncbi:hypothetical protein ACA910_017219 [Epithemia clementina (nom. ined.)]